jgi:ComF family protein
MLATTTNALVRVLLTPACASCDGLLDLPLDGPVCAACWRAVPRLTAPWCVRCGDALPSAVAGPWCARCRRRVSAVTLARSAGRYDDPLRRIIHAFKYGGRRTLAPRLAALMREAGADLLAGADAVVPVPLHPWRAMRRGFNQADDLARSLGLPVWRVLRRRRHGPPQAGLPAGQRHANVQAAYALAPGLPWATARNRLRNRSVVLVDDVMTTGATLEACALVLAEAGVRSVGAVTAARAVAAPPHRPP